MADEPVYSTTTERFYYRLPDIYRETDAQHDYQFKKYISSVLDTLGDIDLLVARFRYMAPNELEMQRRYAQKHTIQKHPDRVKGAPPLASTSDLVDPLAADEDWLPWLGQLVGVYISPNMNIFEKRDSIATASAGYRAGSKYAMEKAVRTVLSGSRYAVALPHTKVDVNGNIQAGTVWDLTILTRASESPDSASILRTIDKPTVKPAGVKLYHRTYSASWDTIEAALPHWRDWETVTWDDLEQVGLVYKNLVGNLVPNPSFEVDAAGWTKTGAITITRRAANMDGQGELLGNFSGAGAKAVESPRFTLNQNTPYTVGLTYSGSVDMELSVRSAQGVHATVPLPKTPAGEKRRIQTGFFAIAQNNVLYEQFEDPAMPGWIAKPEAGVYTAFDRTVRRTGDQSLRLDAETTDAPNYTAYERILPVTPGTTVRFSIWVRKTPDFDGSANWSKLRIAKNDVSRAALATFNYPASALSSTDWTQITGFYNVPATGIAEVVIQLNRDGVAGAVWLDDLTVQTDAIGNIPNAYLQVSTTNGTVNDNLTIDGVVVRDATNQ